MQFKPTQRKNGAIVLAMHKNLGPPSSALQVPVGGGQQEEQLQQHGQHGHKQQRKRHHSSYSPSAKPVKPSSSSSSPSSGNKPSRKH
ncbi:hypothetical protein TWF694_006363 [Orbilia ellipsospora]|uniref:Uncharacterized protein n=1 Tax=Orbilia ellipsospora TaxID=2528407 RepID=A0AAV9XJY7_9PEZI